MVERSQNKDWLIGTAVILVAAIIAVVAVVFFKRPGQMGVIESQTMKMNETPPAGALPVAIDFVRKADITGYLTYTGTVRAYNDEDVYARVTGRITAMYVYPGDHVQSGQLLATLDTGNSEYAAKAAQSKFEAQAAAHDVLIAQQDYAEKKHQAQGVADAEIQAKRALDEAEANFAYWKTEIEREKKLVDQDVVSKQEYDNELAQYKQAGDKVAEARARVAQSQEEAIAAKQEATGMSHHIAHKRELANAAKEGANAAQIVQSYTRITATTSGVVTQRDVSPGVVINPGVRILRIEQMNRVRVQAEVATTDIDRIQLGAPVQIKPSAASNEVIEAHVTARFPAANPTTRTSIIEALIPNPGDRFLPGQYVVMNISVGSQLGLTVPSSAIVYSGNQTQVWKAVGTQAMKTAQLVNVTTGLSSGDRIEVTAGLQDGDAVIYAGQENLQPGAAVVGVKWAANGPAQLPSGAEVSGNRLSIANHWKVVRKSGDYILTASMQPIPPAGGSNKLILQLQTASGQPVTGAKVTAATDMPTMSMPGPNMQAAERQPGIYEFDGNFMSTLWDVDLAVQTPKAANVVHWKIEVDVP